MDADLKAKWLEALRSGKYEQTQGTLRDGDAFCCLGVLCDLTGRGKWIDAGYGSRCHVQRFQYGDSIDFSSTQYFPWPLKAEYRLDDLKLDELMNMNDSGQSFGAIANHIEKNL